MADPELDELFTFVQIASTGSLAAAARKLDLPKSTVSRRLARLEEKLGVRLVNRSTRRISLTDEGIAYRERVADVLNSLEEANVAIREQQAKPRGHLRITAPTDLGAAGLAEVVGEYTRRYPETTVEVLLTERIVDIVGEGIDLALRAATSLPDSTLLARKVADIEIVLVATPAYLSEHGVPARVEDLADHRFAVLSGQAKSQLTLYGPSGERPLTAPVAITANDYSFVHRAALAHSGIATLPSIVAQEDLRAGRLERVLPAYHAGRAGLYVMHASRRFLSAKVRAFRDLLTEHFRSTA